MSVPEALVEVIVRETSEAMTNPNFAQAAVGHFVQSQPAISQYLAAKAAKMGGEAVIHLAFHAELIARCFRRYHGQEVLPDVDFADLDEAAGPDAVARFSEAEPAVAAFLASNVDDEDMREVLALVGLALSAKAARPSIPFS